MVLTAVTEKGTMERNDVCFLIPVYNEAPVIADVVAGIREHYPLVVCVDDGSVDGSVEEIERSGALLVRHPINLGQGASLRTGIEFGLTFGHVRYFVTFDADGQHDALDVATMLEVLDAGGADIVFGSRFLDRRTDVGRAKRAVLRAAVRYTRASSGLSLSDTHNGLRAFTREVGAALDLRMNGMAHASELITIVARSGFRYAEAPVHIHYTDYSKSKGQPLMNAVNIVFDLLLK
jgi:glycosyltransferase involved in cell wall biosynthesis